MAKLPDGWIFTPRQDAKDRLKIVVERSELVRCKNCSHVYYADNRVPSEQSLVCDLTGRNVTPDWFCADGEERGEDE